jgi:hypothetical protein
MENVGATKKYTSKYPGAVAAMIFDFTDVTAGVEV